MLSSGQALTALVGIASAAVLSRLFTQVDYATYRQTMLAYTFAAPFVILGLDRALYYFLDNDRLGRNFELIFRPSVGWPRVIG